MIARRALDALIAVLALLSLAPVLLLVAIWVKLDSAGPVLFRHRRVGLHGQLFDVLKFRTMRSLDDSQGPQVTVAGDARITRSGRWLRSTKLDEVPQLVNVLFGEMSLVGPRPEVEKYVRLYPPEARDVILSVRPGITSVAAIEFRDEELLLAKSRDPQAFYVDVILPRKVELYLVYVRERSLRVDLKILWSTVMALIRR